MTKPVAGPQKRGKRTQIVKLLPFSIGAGTRTSRLRLERRTSTPASHLKGFKGALQADAYSGFRHLYGDGAITTFPAHSRRKFHDIHVVHASPTTTEALTRIAALYGIEEEIRGKPAELRRSIRQARAKPLLDDLRSWIEKVLTSLSAKSETAGAIRYARSHWRALTRYVDDGLLEIGRVEMWRGCLGLA